MAVANRGSFPVAIDGRRYLADLQGYRRGLLPWQRQPIDDGAEAGLSTLNTYGAWRRSQDDFSLGAGQEHFDREGSSRRRVWSSTGLTLDDNGIGVDLTTEVSDPIGMGDILLASSGSSATGPQDLYLASGTTVKTRQPYVGGYTTMTYGGGSVTDIVAGGGYVYVTDGTNIYRAAVGTTSFSSWSSVACERMWIANGRLLVADSGLSSSIKEVGSAGTQVGSDLETAMVIEDVVGTPFGIYVGGWDFTDGTVTGFVKRVPIDEQDGSLGVVQTASVLPETEKVLSLAPVANYAMIGTSRGLRLGRFDGAGFLTYGPWVDPATGLGLPRKGSNVHEMVALAERVWFTFDLEDGTAGGVGVANLSEFVNSTTPSFYIYSGAIGGTSPTSIAAYWDPDYPERSRYPVWAQTVGGTGNLYTPRLDGSTLYSRYGQFETGWISFGIPDDLIPVAVDIRHSPITSGASIIASLFYDDGSSTPTVLGSQVNTGETEKTWNITNGSPSERFRLRFLITNGSGDDTPMELLRWTLRAIPVPSRTTQFVVPLVVRERVDAENRVARPMAMDPREEMDALLALADARTVVAYEEGDTSYNVVVDDVSLPEDPTRDWTRGNGFPQGTVLVSLLTVD